MDVWIVKETCLDRYYELNSTPIKDDWTIIDIGANIGDFAILVGREHPNTRIYAYEPFPGSFELLQENLTLNSINNIISFSKAIGANSGTMLLAKSGESVQHTTTFDKNASSDETIQVESISLDEVFRDNELTGCDYLKMDCEGGEFEILFNASKNTLKKIKNICLEYHDGFTEFTHSNLEDFLQENGFKVIKKSNPVHAYLGLLYASK